MKLHIKTITDAAEASKDKQLKILLARGKTAQEYDMARGAIAALDKLITDLTLKASSNEVEPD